MKQLGTIFGVGVYVATEDKEIIKAITKYLKKALTNKK